MPYERDFQTISMIINRNFSKPSQLHATKNARIDLSFLLPSGTVQLKEQPEGYR